MRDWPTRDPIRTLVECGVGDDVETVIVDGVVRVENRRVLASISRSCSHKRRRMPNGNGLALLIGIRWGAQPDERSPHTYRLRKPG